MHALDMGSPRGRATSDRRWAWPTSWPSSTGTSSTIVRTTRSGPQRDRFLLSIGHYAIALYAALAEAGVLDVAELATYGSDDSRLPMSGRATYTPGMEISGGSLGHGLGVATGMALGLRHQGSDAHVYNLLSDGELDEGSTWEAALACAHHGLDNVTAIVDVNALQADGPTKGVLRTEPVTAKWEAFGWHAIRVDGNDIDALLAAFDALRGHRGSPAVLICDTRIGCGVPMLETREKAHFMRVEEHDWQLARDQLTERHRERSGSTPAITKGEGLVR
jgi:transketolase